MNPHFGHYYGTSKGSKIEPPHEGKEPIPIFYLALNSGTPFRFIARMNRASGIDLTGIDWKALVTSAFHPAFEWLGFGTKTSLGHGRMTIDDDAEKREAEQRAKIEREAQERRKHNEEERAARQERERIESLTPLEQDLEKLAKAGSDQVNNFYDKLDRKTYKGEDTVCFAEALKMAYIRLGKWEGEQKKKQKKRIAKIRRILGDE